MTVRAGVVLGLILLLAPAANGGYYRVVQDGGTWWFQDPAGKKFLSRGLVGANPGVPEAKFDPANPAYCGLRFYPDPGKCREAMVRRMEKWGFNTLGAGSEEPPSGAGTPFVLTLSLGSRLGVPWEDPGSEEAKVRMRDLLGPLSRLKEEPRLLGVFLDGRLGWWDEALFLNVLKRSAQKDPLKKGLVDLLKERYRGDLRLLTADFSLDPEPMRFEGVEIAMRRAEFRPGARPAVVDEFAGWLAERFYSAAVAEVRKVDPNHLVFSDRYAGFYSQPVARAAGKYVDVVALDLDPAAANGWVAPFLVESLHKASRRPVLVSEVSVASGENGSGDANRGGTRMTVGTRKERAAAAERAAGMLARFPWTVGYHWYQYYDEPPGGGDTGPQGYATGLIDVRDGEYRELGDALARASRATVAEHGAWPGETGLRRTPQGWRVGALPELPVVDGSLEEWNLATTWVPATASLAPFERFGDIHVAWHPEGLAVAVVYMDFRTQAPAAADSERDSDRLTIGLGLEDEKPVLFTLKGVQVPLDPDRLEAGFRPPEILAVRGGTPFPPQGRLQVAQRSGGLLRVVELFIPSVLFKTERMNAGDSVRACVSLRLRGNSREFFWPSPFRMTGSADSATWAPLVLEKG